MVIQIIRLETRLSEDELLATAKERADRFRALPGLLQKYYARLAEPGQYGGVYVWDSMESLKAFRESDLAATIPSAYQVTAPPDIETLEVLFRLRDQDG